ncbi:alpha/beta fold hydrolase [Streptomyces sp. ACA25]|uniref:alpha/beta fold hydrolase n=1 Tax=Streptomyces sp. ACA25 TaxID=3022596 RepID=UPI002307470B|nr:alpha/beta fold hydrolase [Streptomyces sp. ACA25]MDB1089562.1 alpha/beta fold hydrolase [Streptomyces sp. ACA25]
MPVIPNREKSRQDEHTGFRARPPRWSVPGDGSRLELATLEVPVDYRDPQGARLTLAVSRLRAKDPAARRGVLVAVHGGPGGDGGLGRRLPEQLADSPVAEAYDLIGVDLRGTGDSTQLHAEESPTTVSFDSRPSDEDFAGLTADMRERERGCERAGGSLRRHISTRNSARDLDVIREVLGEERISYLGYAYGTLLGAVYGTLFPGRLDRSVLDSSVHPGWTWREQFMSQAVATRENVDKWAEWTGERDGHFGLGTSAAAVLATVETVAGAGDHALHTRVDGMIGTLSASRPRWEDLALTVGRLRAALAEGNAEQVSALLAGQSTWRPGKAAGGFREAVLEAVTCETDWPTDLETYYRDMRAFREHYPYGYGVLRAQPWVGTFRSFSPPEPPTVLERAGYPPGIVVQADGDPLDHHSGATAMAERLGHSLIMVDDSGEHEIYRRCGNTAVDAHVDRYLLEGVLPPPRVHCPGPPRPAVAPDPRGA